MNRTRRNLFEAFLPASSNKEPERQSAIAPKSIAGRELWPADGFSPLELERAGISEQQAVVLGLKIDRQRQSALGCNVIELERLAGRENAKHAK